MELTNLHLRVVVPRTSNDDNMHKTLSKAGTYELLNKQQLLLWLLGNINATPIKSSKWIYSLHSTCVLGRLSCVMIMKGIKLASVPFERITRMRTDTHLGQNVFHNSGCMIICTHVQSKKKAHNTGQIIEGFGESDTQTEDWWVRRFRVSIAIS